jgi:DNA-binding NarL/FixJ family response regulator
MQPLSIVICQSDSRLAQALAASLCTHFRFVKVARSIQDVRSAVLRHRADLVILDMELACLSEVEQLHRDFPHLSIVCNHRLADEEMWTSVLAAGAADICSSSDTRGILLSALRNVAHPQSMAA